MADNMDTNGHGNEIVTDQEIKEEEEGGDKKTLSVCKWLKGCIRQNDFAHQQLFLHPWIDNPEWVPDVKTAARMKAQDFISGESDDMTEEERKLARCVLVTNIPVDTLKEELVDFFNQQCMKNPIMDFNFNEEDSSSGNLVHRVARMAAKTMIFDGIVFKGVALTLSREEAYTVPEDLADPEQLLGGWLVVPRHVLLHKRELPVGLTEEEEKNRTVYVTGFRHKAGEGDSTEEKVMAFFNSKFLGHPVYDVQIMEKEVTYAYLSFLSEEEASRALNTNKKDEGVTSTRGHQERPLYFLNRKKLTVRPPNPEEDGKMSAEHDRTPKGPKPPLTEEEITEQTQKAIDQCTKSLIGMQHIYRELKEFKQREGKGAEEAQPKKPLGQHWLFTCVLCKKSSDINNMPVHVASHYHRMNYLKVSHSTVYTNLRKEFPNLSKQEQSVLIEEAVRLIQDEEGTGAINLGPPPVPATATSSAVTAASPGKATVTVFTEPDPQMTKLLEDCKEPLIGTSYIRQMRTTNTKKKGSTFCCSLCRGSQKSDGKITHTLGTITHVLGKNHRLNYIGKHYPDHKSELKKLKNRAEENKLLISVTKTIEEREGKPGHIMLQTEEEELQARQEQESNASSSILGKRARDDSASETGGVVNPAKRTAVVKLEASGETLVDGIRNAITLTQTHALCTREEANDALTLCSLLSDALIKYRIRNPAEASPLMLEGMRRMVHLLDSHSITSDEEASIGFQLGNQLTSSLTSYHQHSQNKNQNPQDQAAAASPAGAAGKKKRQKKRKNQSINQSSNNTAGRGQHSAEQGGNGGGYADNDGVQNGSSNNNWF